MWKWENVPIPPQHIVGALLAILLHFFIPTISVSLPLALRILGGLLALLGISLAGWSVWVVGSVEVEAPTSLIATGPYSFSRNPMYLGWSLFYAGVGLAGTSIWLLASFPIVTAYTHLVDVKSEENMLRKRFGQEYLDYCRRVRRYL